MRRLLRLALPLGLYLAWILIALYPNPTLLVRSIPQALDPKVDPQAVRHWAEELPDDPAYIEQQVLGKYVPYSVPWQTHGVPWYFPTPAEVVQQGSGDCQARMLVLASILEAKGIPYKLQASIDHIWVEYPKKKPNALENKAITVMVNEGGGPKLQVPKRWDWRETYRIEKEYFWDLMPAERKVILFGGLGMVFFRRRFARGLGRLRVRYHASTTPTGQT